MNASELSKPIGTCGTIQENTLTFRVRIVEAKDTWGHAKYLVTPVSGHGSVWVFAERVSFESEVANAK